MGWWKTERGLGGDAWADEFGRMMKNLSAIRHDDDRAADEPVASHEITVADLVEFCSRGHIKADVDDRNGGRPLSELGAYGVETYPNRGQIYCQAGECAV